MAITKIYSPTSARHTARHQTSNPTFIGPILFCPQIDRNRYILCFLLQIAVTTASCCIFFKVFSQHPPGSQFIGTCTAAIRHGSKNAHATTRLSRHSSFPPYPEIVVEPVRSPDPISRFCCSLFVAVVVIYARRRPVKPIRERIRSNVDVSACGAYGHPEGQLLPASFLRSR